MKRRLSSMAAEGDGSMGTGQPPRESVVPTDQLTDAIRAVLSRDFLSNLLSDSPALVAAAAAPRATPVTRFGNTSFGRDGEANVNAFLHQKLGRDNLSRRAGPRGTRLTYIESCKAIELANQAFGFNGWSCQIVECKEEFREKKGERWSIGFSSLVRIQLKDGASHEDVGFGQADGQPYLGAAIEQAKKASISDGRKRALRLFGEYLGNSCYDREHIRDVHSSKPSLAGALPVPVPSTSASLVPTSIAPVVAVTSAVAPSPASSMSAASPLRPQQQSPVRPSNESHSVPPTNGSHSVPPQQPPRGVVHHTGDGGGITSTEGGFQRGPPMQSSTVMSNAQESSPSMRPPYANQSPSPRVTPNSAQPMATVAQQNRPPPPFNASPLPPRAPTAPSSHSSTPPTSNSSSLMNRPPPSVHRSHSIVNGPPPLQMAAPGLSIKSEPPRSLVMTEYDMNDLSLSQFDYDPNDASVAAAAKRMRSY